MYNRFIWHSICRDARYRFKKLYHSFYYAQSHIKYVMLFLFPAIIWSTRFRVDTKLGYYFYINDKELYPDYSKNLVQTQWKNGTKFYIDDEVSVKQMKQIIYQDNPVPKDIKLGCKGRMMEDNDNLALAVRAFCKRDPKIFIWKDEHAQYL